MMDATIARLLNPFWMDRPTEWVWRNPAGHSQGFGSFAYDNVGLANLLWLSLDLPAVPLDGLYDCKLNSVYMRVLLEAGQLRAGRYNLIDFAGSVTLQGFFDALKFDSSRLTLDLCSLAYGRLKNAHA